MGPNTNELKGKIKISILVIYHQKALSVQSSGTNVINYHMFNTTSIYELQTHEYNLYLKFQ